MEKRKAKLFKAPKSFNMVENISHDMLNKNNLVDVLLSIEEEDLKKNFLFRLFGKFGNERLCNPYDLIEIPPGVYGRRHNRPNKNTFVTTIGRWIFNKLYIERDLFDIYGYYNETISSKAFKKINKKLSTLLMEDDISVDTLYRFMTKTDFYMDLEMIISYNHTEKLLTINKYIKKEKERLLKLYKDDLESGNVEIINKIQDELIEYALKEMGDDPSLDMFLSGSQGDIQNTFKDIYIMKGAIKNPIDGSIMFVGDSYVDGISKENYSKMAIALSEGPFNRVDGTKIGGYWEKLFKVYSAYEIIPNTDCGTNRTVTVNLNDDNVDIWMYNYIVDGKNIVELTSKNVNKYINTTVKFRYSSMCEMGKAKLCHKCAGNFFHRLGFNRPGLILNRLPSAVKNNSMKSFHANQISGKKIDANKIFY